MKKPKYVTLNGTPMRLHGNEYWVDAGMWAVKFKEKKLYNPQNFEVSIELVSVIGIPHLNNKVLHPCSESEWYISNKQYVPIGYVFEDGTKTPPTNPNNQLINPCCEISLEEKPSYSNKYKYLVIRN